MNWKTFKNTWIWSEQKMETTYTFDEIMRSKDKEAFIEKWYWRFYRGIYRPIKYLPDNIKYWCREKYQRGQRGWAVSDAWGFDWYLACVIAEGCEWLKKNKHGCPFIVGYGDHNQTPEQFDAMCKEWDRQLDCIIYTFRTAQKIKEDNWYYQPSETWTQEAADRYTKIWDNWKYEPKPRAMTLEECKAYEEGWKYFKENFYSLWD